MTPRLKGVPNGLMAIWQGLSLNGSDAYVEIEHDDSLNVVANIRLRFGLN